MNKFEKYYKTVNFLEGLVNLPMQGDYMIDRNHADVYLKRMRYFLELIGNPDRKLKFIHIGGTSGKGTVTNTVHEILFSAGKKVGSFTSPYVVTSIEKIKVGDKYIHPDEFADIVDYLKPFIDKAYTSGPYGRPSYFEIFLAIALLYFQKQKCEWVVLEVGLGGRYDATNVIEEPAIAAITNIDYDHTEILGKTLKKIAYDKAGIIKSHSVVFTSEQRPTLLRMFGDICKEKSAILKVIPHQNRYHEYNKELAAAIARYLKVEEKYISKGLHNAKLACRFEEVQSSPTVILDGAHNRSKMRSTVENIKRLNCKKLYVVVGIADNKDHSSILSEVIPEADAVFFTRFQNKERKCAHPKELMLKSKIYLKKGAHSEICLDAETALQKALRKAKKHDVILVTGSFFLAGELRKKWHSEESVLKKRKSF